MDIESLKQDIAELEQQEADILGKDTIDQERLKIVRNRLSELRHELEQFGALEQINQAHEARVQESSNDFAEFLNTLDIGNGLTLRQLIPDEGDYQLTMIKLQRGYAQQVFKFSEQIKGFEEREAQLKRQNENLQAKLSDADSEVSRLGVLNAALEQQKADAESKRDAAVRELDDAKAQIKQLNEWNDRLQREKVLGVKGDMKVIDAEEEARLELEAKAKRLVYDVEPVESINPRNFTATLAATSQRISYNWVQKNYYIEVSREEGLQFRQAYEAATGTQSPANSAEVFGQVHSIETPTIPDVEPVVQFPEANPVPDTSATDEMVREKQAQGHSEVVSRAEIDTINKRLDRLEKQAELNSLEVA